MSGMDSLTRASGSTGAGIRGGATRGSTPRGAARLVRLWAAFRVVPHGNFGAVLQFVKAGQRNHIAWLNSLNGRDTAVSRADSDRLHRDRLIGLDQIHESVLSITLNGGCSDQGRVLLRIHQQSCVYELIWE